MSEETDARTCILEGGKIFRRDILLRAAEDKAREQTRERERRRERGASKFRATRRPARFPSVSPSIDNLSLSLRPRRGCHAALSTTSFLSHLRFREPTGRIFSTGLSGIPPSGTFGRVLWKSPVFRLDSVNYRLFPGSLLSFSRSRLFVVRATTRPGASGNLQLKWPRFNFFRFVKMKRAKLAGECFRLQSTPFCLTKSNKIICNYARFRVT